MSVWYAICSATGLDFLSLTFMQNALLAVIIMTPLFGILSTMVVTMPACRKPSCWHRSAR